MSSSRDSCEDWIARARRGGLSHAEQRQFHELLESSLEARLLYEASCAFDREACVMAGDEARLERIARQLQQRHRRHRRWVPVRSLSLGVAAGILVAGVAVGAVNYSKVLRGSLAPVTSSIARAGVVKPTRSAIASVESTPVVAASQTDMASASAPLTEPVGSSRSEPTRAPMLAGVRSPLSTPGPASTGLADSRAEEAPARARNHAVGRFDDVGESPSPAATPLSLFTEANRARVQGNTVISVAGYERLISEFPLSRLALGARISLGMLYLQQGRADSALAQFRIYASSGGPLMAEALWGQAQAARALGQRASEREALERILREYPQSAYVSAAQNQLTARE